MSDLPDFSAYGYQTIRQLGLNAAGGRVVYLATDRKTKRQVVIKQFQFAKGSGWSEFKAVEREIQVLQGLNHKGIPHYVGSFESNDGYCIVQEYKNAQTLSALHSYTPEQIKQIAVSVLEILVYLQNRIPPIIHRDIKPENIVVDKQLNVYLIDFGFARLGGGTAAMSSVAAGTFGFMAPEQIYNKDLTEATDLYGLGATLIALLTGRKSTEMDTLIDEDNKIAFQSLVPKLSFRFIEWLEKMVAPKLSDRYPDAATAIEAVQPLDIIRFPSVEFSSPDLKFTATQLGERVTRTITIINPTQETVLEGKWSVAPHPNDPPSLPNSDSHAWISFSPREFKGNEIECQITVDISRLTAKARGKRSLILHTNAVPETHAMPLYVETAPFPVSKKLPYLTTALLLIVPSLTGLFGAHVITTKFNINASQAIGAFVYFILIYLLVCGATSIVITLFTFSFEESNVESVIKFSFVLIMLGFLLLVLAGSVSHDFKSIPLYFGAILVLSTAPAIVGMLARQYLELDKLRRYASSYLILLMLVTGAFGISLGICLKLGFLSNFYLLAVTLGTGVLSVSLFFFPPLQRRRLLAAYRQHEPNLIRP